MTLQLIIIVAGIALLVGVGVTVGIMEAQQRAAWRAIASERRQRWEDEQDRLQDDE